MTPPEILDALIEIENIGATIRLIDGQPRLFGNVSDIPDGPRSLLRSRMNELAEYLAVSDRPSPRHVLFVSKRLNYVEVPAVAVRDVSVFFVGDAPYFRVNPNVAMWVTESANGIKKKIVAERGDMDLVRRVEGVVADLWEWVMSYFPAHRIRAAQQRSGSLPIPPKPMPSCPGHDAWSKSLV